MALMFEILDHPRTIVEHLITLAMIRDPKSVSNNFKDDQQILTTIQSLGSLDPTSDANGNILIISRITFS